MITVSTIKRLQKGDYNVTDLEILIEKDKIRDQIFNYCRALDRIDNELGYTIFAEEL